MAALPALTGQDWQAWLRLGMWVRLALYPNHPDAVRQYMLAGLALSERWPQTAWEVHDRMFSLLLDTADDEALPDAWRMLCLDGCCRPLGEMGRLVTHDVRAARFRWQASRLARFSFLPTMKDSSV